ncbi:unnamed protein product [[Candida] boidinii]|nr:unnamed protein product [[Candida] boidinii]
MIITTEDKSKRSIEEVDSTESELKRRRFENLSNINNEIVKESIEISNIGNLETIKVEKTIIDTETPNEVLQITEEETVSSTTDIKPVTTNSQQSNSISLTSQTTEKEESDLDSDFEIPEIEIDSDDE